MLEDIFPKKKAVWEAKCQNFLTLYIVDDRVVFFQPRDAPFIPTLRILHKCTQHIPVLCSPTHFTLTHQFVLSITNMQSISTAKLRPTNSLQCIALDPSMLPKMQVDRGAAKFIMTGAQITCPGLTSPGGRMDDVEEGTIVAVMVEGKEHPVAIGVTLMSTEQM